MSRVKIDAMMTPEQFAADFIFRWEDGKQKDPDKTHSMRRNDRGNWTGGAIGVGKFVGSNHGVTAPALAGFRGVPLDTITYDLMHRLTLQEAGQIALKSYYRANGLDALPFDPVIASVFDFGWGAGAVTGVRKFQKTIGTVEDGHAGPASAARYLSWRGNRAIEQAARLWADVRIAYYEKVIAAHPEQAENRNGWRNRTAYFLPGHPEGWYARFMA